MAFIFEWIYMGGWSGLFISILIHVMILSLPFSMTNRNPFREVELFIMFEEPLRPPGPIIKHMEKKLPPNEQKLQSKESEWGDISEELPVVRKAEVEKIEPFDTVVKNPKEETKKISRVEPPVININKQTIEVKETFETNETEETPIVTVDRSQPPPPNIERINQSVDQIDMPSTPLPGTKTTTSLPQRYFLKEPDESPSLIETTIGFSDGPRFLYREMPKYPLLARRLRKEGKVVLKLTIDEKGNLLNIDIIEAAGFGFLEAAIQAVKRSTFLPAKKEGKPVTSRAILPIRFTLSENASSSGLR
jgi:protein TonB